MGLFGAMTASVSGLNSQGEAISVISDNLSNTNTIGYKSSRSLFSQLVTTSGSSGGTYNAGGASSVVQRGQDTQGSVISTTSATDLTLSGDGFFSVTDSATITTDTSFFYTRAGAFVEDKQGFLVNPDGYYLQGWQTDSDGNIIDVQNPESIELQSVGVSAQATSEARIGLNLTSTATTNANYVYTSFANAMDAFVASPTDADYVTDVRVYDAQGGARDASVAFTKRGPNMWDWIMYTDGTNIQGATAGVNQKIGNGTLEFNTDGSLKYVTATTGATQPRTGDSALTIDWAGGVDDGSIDMYFGDYTGGNIVTATTNLDLTDNIHHIAIEDQSHVANSVASVNADAGTYSLAYNTGTTTLTLTDPTGDTATVTGFSAADQELIFSFTTASGDNNTYDVRMTVDAGFNPAVTGAVGDFTVADQAVKSEGLGTDGAIQFAANFNTSFVNQNGFGSGTLSNIQVDEEGFISGTFTNGETKKLWKVAVGVFQNPAGLETVSGSLLRVTEDSGQVLLKEAGVGSTASIVAGALEGSTVDIANEFSQMIVAQRSYQANSTVISTVDQMLNELLQLR